MSIHSHSTYEFHYIYEGSVDFEADGEVRVLQAGDLLLVPSYKYHSVKKHSQPFVKTSVIFSFEENKNVSDFADSFTYYSDLYSQIDKICVITPDKSYFYGLRQCIESFRNDNKLNIEKFRSLLKLIFINIGEKLARKTGFSKLPEVNLESDFGSENMIRAKQIEDYIHLNFKENITSLGTALLNMSESKLDVDYIMVSGKDAKVEVKGTNFFSQAWHEMKSLVASFFVDYDAVGDVYDEDETGIRLRIDRSSLFHSQCNSSDNGCACHVEVQHIYDPSPYGFTAQFLHQRRCRKPDPMADCR
jgi:cupin superfamily acireductone dioxygenase involved in methionine salvage